MPGRGGAPPGWAAQLTRMSIRPSSAAARATAASTDGVLPVSAGMAITRRLLCAEISAAVAASVSGLRARMARCTPSLASTLAMALPMPLLPPVTMAVLFASWRSMRGILRRDSEVLLLAAHRRDTVVMRW